MTDIPLTLRLEDSASDTEPILSAGWRYRVRPGKDYTNGSGESILAEWPTGGGWKPFNSATVTLKLDPLAADNPYLLQIQGPPDPTSKDRTPVRREEYRLVVSGTANNTPWYNLTRVSGPGPDATVYGVAGYADLTAQIAALTTRLDNIVLSGGSATSLGTLTGVSTDGKTLIDTGSTFSSMRTDLNVPAIDGNIGAATATTPTAGDATTKVATTAFVDTSFAKKTGATLTNPTLTGTVTVDDGAFAIADTNGLQAALDLKAPKADPVFTGTADLVNLDVSGSVAIPDDAISIAKVALLQEALDASHSWTSITSLPGWLAGVPGAYLPWELYQPGSTFRVYCPGDVQPDRPTPRGDLYFQYWKVNDITYGGTKAIVGSDTWVPWDG